MHSLANDIVGFCWIVFMIVWVLAAIFTKRTVYRESRISRLRYSLLLVAGCLLLLKGRRLEYPLNAIVIPETDSIALTGAIFCLLGLAFCFWARAALGRNWSGEVTLKEGHELIEFGPYRIVRHPIYTGLLAMLVGTAMVLGHLAGIIGVLVVFLSFWIKLRDEEKVMRAQFPDRYAAYQQRVKRIIPFVL